ncbi:MAG: peptidase S41 [Bacteroidetes bacterium HGW-Bacteroidetes-6]|nr:MAG: peptidase S41 [Bacteroidetes bacterium HGW-Bacteroidetes-6]
MKRLLLLFPFLLFFVGLNAQQNAAQYDMTFENSSAGSVLPSSSVLWGSNYTATIQSNVVHGGANSLEITRNADAIEGDFGCFVFTIPVTFSGKTISFKAFMKSQDVTDGYASLFVRMDGTGNGLYFNNNMSNLKGTKDWAEFNTATINLPEGANTINIGVILTGKGSLWADDFQLLVDGKDYTKAPVRKDRIFAADSDTAFSKQSNIELNPLNNSQVSNLALLCKLWGFLKYYHPAIAAGKYNWDNELFRFIPRYIQAETREARNDSLLVWVNSLGPVSGKGNKMKIKKNVKLIPELDWISDTTVLGTKLSAELVKIRNSKRSKTNYYVSLSGAQNPSFDHEKSYSNISWNDDGFRLLTVFRFYNMVEYFFPNKHLIGENWQNIPAEFIEKILETTDETSAQLVVLELVARINDTHASVKMSKDFSDNYFGRNYANYKVSFIENKAVITGYINQNLTTKDDLQPGDILLDIAGENVSAKVDRLKKYISASNDAAKLRIIGGLLLRSNNRGIPVTIERRGVTRSANLPCHSPEAIFAKTAEGSESTPPTWRFLTPEIGYIYLGTASNKELSKMMGELRLTKGIVIDIRCYPSDFLVFTLSQYFHVKKTAIAKFSRTNLQNPGLFEFTDNVVVPGMKTAYNGKLVILVNETTQSSAEYHAMSFRSASTATVVGSTTAGADGNVSQIILPGDIRTWFSGIGVYYPDGTETQRVGIVPDVFVTPTLQGYRDGRDEVLEKAVQIIEGR